MGRYEVSRTKNGCKQLWSKKKKIKASGGKRKANTPHAEFNLRFRFFVFYVVGPQQNRKHRLHSLWLKDNT